MVVCPLLRKPLVRVGGTVRTARVRYRLCRSATKVNDTRRAFEARAPQVLAQVRAAAVSGPINILALSGGGVGAAFGAGAVVGWTREGARPEFQIVTGVSAGALIAPFAFLGPGWDEQLTDVFSGARTQYLLQPHWMSAVFRSSVYRGKPLLELLDRYVTAKVLRAVAAEAAKGRLLLVATTDLDKQQTVIWNLGVIAAQGGESARRLFRDVIVAARSQRFAGLGEGAVAPPNTLHF